MMRQTTVARRRIHGARGARGERGFTLIELLAAITLLAVLAAVLAGTVRGAERSTTSATDVVERTEQYSRAQAFLREHVAGMLPLRWRKDALQPLKFDGRADRMTYLAPVTSQIAEGGLTWWQLIVARDGSPARSKLLLRRQPIDPEEKQVPDLSTTPEPIMLADNIESLAISYFDAGDDPLNNPDAGTWLNAWDENARTPTMVNIRVTEVGGKRWPDLIVPLKLTQALGCNFDFQRQRCIISNTAAQR